MLSTIRKCSKKTDDSLDVPDHLYVDAIKQIDSYLLRARTSDGWNQGYVPADTAQRSDSVVRFILFRKRFTRQRIIAIDEAIKNGTSPVINVDELKSLGLNFNVICNLWLSDVDVNEKDFPTFGQKRVVPKFLNRMLGLSLPKQKLLTDYFLSFLQVEVKAAKSAGKQTCITTLSGRCVEIVDKPRSFCFGDGKLEVYKVVVDGGMSFEEAFDIYSDELAMQSAASGAITTGFYTQQGSRHKFPKVFLIISPDERSDKVILYRPNTGRKVVTKQYATRSIRWGDWNIVTSDDEIKDLWDTEFALSDIPYTTGKSALRLVLPAASTFSFLTFLTRLS